MSKKLFLLVLALVFCLGSSLQAQTIIWVSGAFDDNAEPGPDDPEWIELLEAEGYTVDLSFRNAEGNTLDDDKIAALEAADLIIFSRNSNSGDHDDDATEIMQWNSLTTPMINSSTHLIRNSRWLWLNTTSLGSLSGSAISITAPDHPIFAGIPDQSVILDDPAGPSSFPSTLDVGNGTLLAQVQGSDSAWIVTWETGDEFYPGAGQFAGGQRMLFCAGTQEGGDIGRGEMNLTPVGVRLFMNAVRFMLGAPLDRTQAFNPDPDDGALIADTWATVSWSPGDSALSHDVYMGDNLDDVSEGLADTFQGNQMETSLIVGFPGFPFPEGLVPGTTYYWRVDEVNDADPNSPWKGDIWSFSVPPKTAYFPDPIDGAEFVDLDATLAWTPGFGAKLHTVYIGDNYDEVDSATGGAPQATATYKPASPLEAEKVYYWRVDEFDVAETHKGDIWAFTTPGAAGNSQPAKGAVDVQILTTLSWTPADTAASSDLYFGTDADAVKNATTASPEYVGNRALGSESHDPGKLVMGADYHWRVDAVYPDKTVKGLLWSFTTAAFITVDDFEAYNDFDPPDPNSNRIFDSWIDGFGTTTNGALVGNDLPPYAGQIVVHSGAQAMPYFFDNNLKTSEATLTLVYPKDWTAEGVTRLSLWFRGRADNAAERMFVALNGTAVVYHDDSAVTQIGKWTEWSIDLQQFADQGVNLTNVNTVTIGFGTKNSPTAGGSGQMHFDDIRLY
ncbi:MAG: fibronectin type III domain-containing protein [Planctomycetota bacterium]|jgi:hypothetical protein